MASEVAGREPLYDILDALLGGVLDEDEAAAVAVEIGDHLVDDPGAQEALRKAYAADLAFRSPAAARILQAVRDLRAE